MTNYQQLVKAMPRVADQKVVIDLSDGYEKDLELLEQLCSYIPYEAISDFRSGVRLVYTHIKADRKAFYKRCQETTRVSSINNYIPYSYRDPHGDGWSTLNPAIPILKVAEILNPARRVLLAMEGLKKWKQL
jgi:hypothetical protein